MWQVALMPQQLIRPTLLVVLTLFSFLMSSCSSNQVKQQCEKTNWFAYGRSLAMSGHRISSDPVVRQCAASGAEINEVAVGRGFRSGRESVLVYCQRANGYPVGATGRKYKGICPQSLEAAFLVGFNRGRSAYLNASIANNEDEMIEAQKAAYRSPSAEGILLEQKIKQEFLRRKNRELRVELTALDGGGGDDDDDDSVL